MAIISIAAADRSRAIGKNGTIPWHYSADMKFFKEQTQGHVCVMGHKTWLSLKKPLKNRLNIVLSRSSCIEPQPGVLLFRDIQPVLDLKPYLASHIYIIGGEQIYKAFLPYTDGWIITNIPLVIDGADAFLPENHLEGFSRSRSQQLEENLTATFYERNAR